MKRMHFAALATGLLLLAACQKQSVKKERAVPEAEEAVANVSAAACQPGMYQLSVDPATGKSYLYKVVGSPSAGPISVTPIPGSLSTNQLLTCSGSPILFASGLSYDPTTGIFWGTTGASGSPANNILKFTDPNCITVVPAVAACAISLDLSDVERDPVTGAFYAINRGTVNPNNRIVKLGLPSSATVNCLSTFLSTSVFPRGLTWTNTGLLYVMAVTGTSGRLLDINTSTGAITTTYSYPGAITPSPGVNIPEMGLHYDYLCLKYFITGNYDPTSLPTLYTDGLPSGLGGPIYATASGVLPSTVDFARP